MDRSSQPIEEQVSKQYLKKSKGEGPLRKSYHNQEKQSEVAATKIRLEGVRRVCKYSSKPQFLNGEDGELRCPIKSN
jgi:hypothetical protein